MGARGPQRLQPGAREWLHHSAMALINWLLRWPSHALRIAVLRHLAAAHVGSDCTIERRVRITGRRGLVIGSNTIINAGVLLDARGELTIGAHVNISPDAAVFTADHDPRAPDFHDRKRPVTIGDRSWIASRAIILPGTEVGEGAIVAAGAVVHGHVAPRTIVAGNPARPVGERPPEAQRELRRYRLPFH